MYHLWDILNWPVCHDTALHCLQLWREHEILCGRIVFTVLTERHSKSWVFLLTRMFVGTILKSNTLCYCQPFWKSTYTRPVKSSLDFLITNGRTLSLALNYGLIDDKLHVQYIYGISIWNITTNKHDDNKNRYISLVYHFSTEMAQIDRFFPGRRQRPVHPVRSFT